MTYLTDIISGPPFASRGREGLIFKRIEIQRAENLFINRVLRS